MAKGLMDLMGKAPRGRPGIPGGDSGDRKVPRKGGQATYARYDGSDASPEEYFARGGAARSSGALQRAGYFARGGFSAEVGPRPVHHPPSIPGGGAARYAGGPPPNAIASKYFAEGGEAKEPEVTPQLKLAAYELLECLDRMGGGGDKGSRAESVAKHLLAFFHLAEQMPHEEGPHEEPDDGDEGEDEEYGED